MKTIITKSQYAGLRDNHQFVAEKLDKFLDLLYGTLLSFEVEMIYTKYYDEFKPFSCKFESDVESIVNTALINLRSIDDRELRIFSNQVIIKLEETFYLHMHTYKRDYKYIKLIWKRLNGLKSSINRILREV